MADVPFSLESIPEELGPEVPLEIDLTLFADLLAEEGEV